MKHSEILQIALDRYLAQPTSDTYEKPRCICTALSRAVAGRPTKAIVNKDEIIKHIMESLHPANAVTNWLMLNNYIGRNQTEFERDQVQLYRKRWMLHLIGEYKKQGK